MNKNLLIIPYFIYIKIKRIFYLCMLNFFIFLNLEDKKIIYSFKLAPKYQKIFSVKTDSKIIKNFFEKRNKKSRRDNIDRANLITNIKNKKILDIGCNVGFLGFHFYSKLKNYSGVDNDFDCIRAANSLKKYRSLDKLDFYHEDIYDFLKSEKKDFDICFFFSVYHHLLTKNKKMARSLLKLISLRCKVMYFDMGQIDERDTYPNRHWYKSLDKDKKSKDFIIGEVFKYSNYKKYKIIGETQVGKIRRLLFEFK